MEHRTSFSRRRDFWKIRQVSAYARPDAVRIGATVSDGDMKALAFARNGKVTVMLLSDGQTRAYLEGTYGVSRSPYGEEMGLQTLKEGGALTVDNARFAGEVLTVYPYAGALDTFDGHVAEGLGVHAHGSPQSIRSRVPARPAARHLANASSTG